MDAQLKKREQKVAERKRERFIEKAKGRFVIEVSKSRIRKSARAPSGSEDSESSMAEDKQEAQEVDEFLDQANQKDVSSDEEVPAKIPIS